jgi:uncharacterized membrane protein YdcZ (DUF606 family)
VSGFLAFCVGTAAFAIAFAVLRLTDFWRDESNGWWLWVAAASTVGGLLGVWVFAMRTRRTPRAQSPH